MNCQHEGCRCQAAGEEMYCSDYCRDHAEHGDAGDHACECGHPACTAVT